MDRCEECGEERIGVIKRSDGRLLCNDCDLHRIRALTPTGFARQIRVPYLEE